MSTQQQNAKTSTINSCLKKIPLSHSVYFTLTFFFAKKQTNINIYIYIFFFKNEWQIVSYSLIGLPKKLSLIY